MWATITMGVLDFVFDVWSIFDIVLNLLTPYISSSGQLAYHPAYTARHYVISARFWIDAVSSFPLDWPVAFWLPRFIPLFRLNRIIKLLRARYYLAALERVGNLSSAQARAAEVILAIAYSSHITACLMHLIISVDGEHYGIAYTQVEPFYEYGVMSRYLYTLSWAIGSLTGYSGTQAITTLQIVFGCFVSFVGFSELVLLVGTVGSTVMDSASRDADIKLKQDTIDQYLRYRRTTKELRDKVRSYYTFLYRSRKGWDEEEILQDLPPYLRMEVAMDMNRKIIEKVPLFQAAGDNRMFISSLVLSLLPRMVTPGAMIVKQGDVAQEMFFIASGKVEIVIEGGKVVATLPEGSFFGEIALLHNTRRTASVRAATFVDLYVLTKEAFDRIAEDFPEAIEAIRREADRRSSSTAATTSRKSKDGGPSAEEDKNEEKQEEDG